MNKILLIDDNDLDNFINRKVIESSGLDGEIREFSSGEAALDFLKTLRQPGVYSRIYTFLDLNMPVMDGFQFLEKFEELHQEIKDTTTIVVVSSSVNPEDAKAAQAHPRVHLYISKPLTVEHVRLLFSA